MPASWNQLFFQILLLLISCRHINTKTPGQPDVKSVVLKGKSHTERVEVHSPANLALECTWTGDQNRIITGFWRKDGLEIENSRVTLQPENEQYNLKRTITIDSQEHLGNYSCMFGSEAKVEFVLAVPQIGEVRDKPIVSYVGDSVVIACKMEDTKPKPSTWNWYRANGTEKEQILTASNLHRYEIKNKEGKLLVHNLTEADSGWYYCEAVYPISTTMGHVELRVITFHEPLKPFIAIVVEVIILVAAILLYEKSRSKKNSPAGNGTDDQTSTMTGNKHDGSEEGTSMRQRKV